MQLRLPIFPQSIKLITPNLGVLKSDEIVTYFHCGAPIFNHEASDLRSFRYITSKFIDGGLCKGTEVSRCFGVSSDSVRRSLRILRSEGEDGFFGAENRHGHSYKLVGSSLVQAQKFLDLGWNNSRIARELGIREGTVRYALKTGKLKKKSLVIQSRDSGGSNRSERTVSDAKAGNGMGIATTRVEDRVLAAKGKLSEAPTIFESSDNVCQAGVLFMLPALCSQGLLQGMSVYEPLEAGYYGLTHVMLLLSFMALSRIKNPEQLKQCKPGELGKLMGLDRVPEARCLRVKIREIVDQQKAGTFNRCLFQLWIGEQQGAFFFYIDGHVRVYTGSKANLPKKHVSRQKLCLAGTMDYWVNNEQGLPYLMVTEELNYKLKAAILDLILPMLMEDTAGLIGEAELERDPDLARFTLVFDREAYEPAFFELLWLKYRVAVITYRKNVQDKWNKDDFKEVNIEIDGRNISMHLCEKKVVLNGVEMREVRRLQESGHQTAIITTNRYLCIDQVAVKMFARWTQENFFKYAMDNFELDRIIEYGVDSIDLEKKVVNPIYNNLSQKLKKVREKKARVDARLFEIVEKNMDEDIDKVKESLIEAGDLQDKKKDLEMQIQQLLAQRAQHPSRITLEQMPKDKRYNKLKTESKLFINTIKMVAYRAESAMANTIAHFYKKATNEARMLIKEIIKSDADIKPDYNNKTLTITLHSLSTPRANKAAAQLAEIINETEVTIQPPQLG